MKVNINVDVGSIFLGGVIGVVIAPYFYGEKNLKKTAKIGAAKEVVKETRKSIFGRNK